MNLFINAYEASNDWHDVTTKSSAEELRGHPHASWHKFGYKTFFELMLVIFFTILKNNLFLFFENSLQTTATEMLFNMIDMIIELFT